MLIRLLKISLRLQYRAPDPVFGQNRILIPGFWVTIHSQISRFIYIGFAGVPVSELVPVLMNHLPLREDMTEYERVFKALNVL